jgi:D-sedoheptulose 7-phosphate isomerase
MQDQIEYSVNQAQEAIAKLKTQEAKMFIESAAKAVIGCYRRGGKLLIAGNGGSLCDAMHFAEELSGFFRKKRKALPAIALADPAHLTCVGNDIGFEEIFARGVEAYGREGDFLIVLTTSGQSKNLIRAVEVAKNNNLGTIAFLGKTGGQLKGVCDLEWTVSEFPFSDRIQEVHMAAIHIIIEQIEKQLFFLSKRPERAQAMEGQLHVS